MKITICGSLTFAKELKEIATILENIGHSVTLPGEIDDFLSGTTNAWGQDIEKERTAMITHYHRIAESDAIIVANFEKNGIPGYIGGATLLEMGIACYKEKKIFILNHLPASDMLRYVQEIVLMKPIIINGDLTLIQ